LNWDYSDIVSCSLLFERHRVNFALRISGNAAPQHQPTDANFLVNKNTLSYQSDCLDYRDMQMKI